MLPATAERTPLPYEMHSLGYPRWRTNRGHDAGDVCWAEAGSECFSSSIRRSTESGDAPRRQGAVLRRTGKYGARIATQQERMQRRSNAGGWMN